MSNKGRVLTIKYTGTFFLETSNRSKNCPDWYRIIAYTGTLFYETSTGVRLVVSGTEL
jgi:hypothetical protein